MYVRFKWIIWYSWLYISICAIIPTLSYLFIYIICIYVVYILIIHVAVSPPDYRFMDQSTNHDGLDFRLSHMSLIPPIFISTIIILAWQNKYLLIPLYSHYIYIYLNIHVLLEDDYMGLASRGHLVVGIVVVTWATTAEDVPRWAAVKRLQKMNGKWWKCGVYPIQI